MKEKLEIFIITYNRCKHLRSTLVRLAERRRLRECPITILDNHSTDHTAAVCESVRPHFRDLRIVRHAKNIGADANNLRAVEMAQKTYTWILCDDDDLDLTKSDDLWRAVREERADIISVPVANEQLPATGYQNLSACSFKGQFLLTHSFTSAAIFRTDLFTSDLIQKGYRNCQAMFPQFAFFVDAIEHNRLVYYGEKPVITKGSNAGYSAFGFVAGWLHCSRQIQSAALRRQAIQQVMGRNRFLKTILYASLLEWRFRKGANGEDFHLLSRCLFALNPIRWIQLHFLRLAIAPGVATFSWNCFRRYRRSIGQPMPAFDGRR